MMDTDSCRRQVGMQDGLSRRLPERCTTSVENRLEPNLTRYLRAYPITQWPLQARVERQRNTTESPTLTPTGLAYFTRIAVQLTGYTSAHG